jgi:hypothetical protein
LRFGDDNLKLEFVDNISPSSNRHKDRRAS